MSRGWFNSYLTVSRVRRNRELLFYFSTGILILEKVICDRKLFLVKRYYGPTSRRWSPQCQIYDKYWAYREMWSQTNEFTCATVNLNIHDISHQNANDCYYKLGGDASNLLVFIIIWILKVWLFPSVCVSCKNWDFSGVQNTFYMVQKICGMMDTSV